MYTEENMNAGEIKVAHTPPPDWIYGACLQRFKIDPLHTVWTYDGVIYNPGGDRISDHVIAHEATHIRQQNEIGADEWWNRALTDDTFRAEQEAQAYGVQYGFYCGQEKNRDKRARFLFQLAGSYASMYGLPISIAEAQATIKDLAPKFA